MQKHTRLSTSWCHLVEKIIQPGGPLGRVVILILASTPGTVSIAVIVLTR